MQSLRVSPDLDGIRLQDFLERELPEVRRPVLRRLVAAGDVAVNRMAGRASLRLRAGDLVELEAPGDDARRVPSGGPPEPKALYEDDAFLVLDKPSGLYTVPDRHGRDPGLHGMLKDLRPGQDLRIAHRLDRETSGCIVLAKGLAAARHLDAAFRAGRVHKRYLALVHGEVLRDRQVVDRPLGPDPRRPGMVRVAAADDRRAREARTEVEVIERFRGYTLVWLVPATGRGHQLRVHLCHLGHPLVGDVGYGGAPLLLSRIKRGYKMREGVVERPLVERTFLHAARLSFPGLAEGPAIAVEAPLPGDLERAIDKLRHFAASRARAGRRDSGGLREGAPRGHTEAGKCS